MEVQRSSGSPLEETGSFVANRISYDPSDDLMPFKTQDQEILTKQIDSYVQKTKEQGLRLSAEVPVKQDLIRLSWLKLSSDVVQGQKMNNHLTMNVDELKAIVKTVWLMPRDKFIEMQIEVSSTNQNKIEQNENWETRDSRLSSINTPMESSHEVRETEDDQ